MKVSEKHYDEATSWLARLRATDVSSDDHVNFATWLAEDKAHKAAFDAMLQIWEDLGLVGQLDTADFAPASVPPLTKKVAAEKVRVEPGPSSTLRWLEARKMSLKTQGFLALAATFLFSMFALFEQQQDTIPEYSTATGQFKTLTLEDGSQVKLNSNTSISVNFCETERLVHVNRGEAFFQVKKDAQRVFIVKGEHGSAKAIGTAFTVRELGDETRVTVTEGTVKVANGGQISQLGAGEQASIYEEYIDSMRVDAEAITAWRDGRLEYDGVTLEQLIADLNRYMPRKVVLPKDDAELRNHRVSGILTIADQEAMLQALQKSLSIPIKFSFLSDNKIVIKRTN